MKTVVKDLFRKQDEFGGKEITVSGWIRNIRISKNFGFIELNDGTFFKNLQIVIASDKLDNFADLSKLNIAAAITATGTLAVSYTHLDVYKRKQRYRPVSALQGQEL